MKRSRKYPPNTETDIKGQLYFCKFKEGRQISWQTQHPLQIFLHEVKSLFAMYIYSTPPRHNKLHVLLQHNTSKLIDVLLISSCKEGVSGRVETHTESLQKDTLLSLWMQPTALETYTDRKKKKKKKERKPYKSNDNNDYI